MTSKQTPSPNRILVIGSSNTDMVIKTEKLPAPGETILGGRFLMNPGGKGANQAVAAARLGGKVTFIGKRGNDLFGNQAMGLFMREGIDTQYIVKDPELPSGVALITVDSAGENSIVVAPGSNGNLLQEDIPVKVFDFEYDYRHEDPFPVNGVNSELVNKNFDLVFGEITKFIS